MSIFPGWTVTRAISPDVWAGLVTGQFTLHGGVIRYAAGTAQAGQIVRHLIPASTNLNPLNAIPALFNTYQLQQVSTQVKSVTAATQQVLQLATGTAVVSGFTLAISLLGFSALNKSLNSIEGRLKRIEKTVRDIHNFLQLTENARLRVAIKDLLNIEYVADAQHRHTILHNSRVTLAELHEKYKELLGQAPTLELAETYEEYYSVTALAKTRCTAELDMVNVAYQELLQMTDYWKTQARRIASKFLLGIYPERFLCADFAKEVPISTFIEWLDFACNEQKGYQWVDEMRGRTYPWYSDWEKQDTFNWLQTKITNPTSLIYTNPNYGHGDPKKDTEKIIPLLNKLIARNRLYDGYLAQYEQFHQYNLKPSDVEKRIAQLPQKAITDGYFILAPEKPKKQEKALT